MGKFSTNIESNLPNHSFHGYMRNYKVIGLKTINFKQILIFFTNFESGLNNTRYFIRSFVKITSLHVIFKLNHIVFTAKHAKLNLPKHFYLRRIGKIALFQECMIFKITFKSSCKIPKISPKFIVFKTKINEIKEV